MKGCWPGSFVLQNFLSVSFTTPVAWTVMVSPLAIVGEPSGAGVTVIFFVLRPLILSQARALVQRCAATSVRAKRRAMIAIYAIAGQKMRQDCCGLLGGFCCAHAVVCATNRCATCRSAPSVAACSAKVSYTQQCCVLAEAVLTSVLLTLSL